MPYLQQQNYRQEIIRMSSSVSHGVHLFQVIVRIPTFSLGLLFNLSALWILLFKIRKWTEITTYMGSLIFSDCLLLFSLTFKMSAYINTWGLGRPFCSFLESLYFVNMYGSILIIMCISVDRYIAVRHPFLTKSLRSPLKATLVCAAVWTIIFGSSAESYKLHDGTHVNCFHSFSYGTWEKVHVVATMETLFVASALIMTFCSIEIVRAIKRRRRDSLELQKQSNNKSVKIVLANLFTFLICFVPYHIAVLLYFLVRHGTIPADYREPLRIFVQVSLCVANINCMLDGIC
ncbi:lysophosphatidic acid receptor 6-like [Polyodon spathula]|uniref:lysophosphatidic acid receptor 6-like n=1 Tax=Polyodon spathula TaxID=7913 RepID=UPI001B7E0AA4|nr:lysophosphatidic acid receptor 6-like [Polyodon spathula]XP_041125709.1 lysophosphatidic acid receptor 6-like [Polyodon spathula]